MRNEYILTRCKMTDYSRCYSNRPSSSKAEAAMDDEYSLLKSFSNELIRLSKNSSILLESEVSDRITKMQSTVSSVVRQIIRLNKNGDLDELVEETSNAFERWFKYDLHENIITREYSSDFERRTFVFKELNRVQHEIETMISEIPITIELMALKRFLKSLPHSNTL